MKFFFFTIVKKVDKFNEVKVEKFILYLKKVNLN